MSAPQEIAAKVLTYDEIASAIRARQQRLHEYDKQLDVTAAVSGMRDIATQDNWLRIYDAGAASRQPDLDALTQKIEEARTAYFDIADAIARDSTGPEDLANKARETRMQLGEATRQLDALSRERDEAVEKREQYETFRNEVQRIDNMLGDAKLQNVLDHGGSVAGHVARLIEDHRTLRAELADVDRTLGNVAAFDACTTRVEKIALAMATAKRADEAERANTQIAARRDALQAEVDAYKQAMRDNHMTANAPYLSRHLGELCVLLGTNTAEALPSKLREEQEKLARLDDIVERASNSWLALQVDHPIVWEGDLADAMTAACANIRNSLQRNAALMQEIERQAEESMTSATQFAETVTRLQAESDALRQQVETLTQERTKAREQRNDARKLVEELQDKLAGRVVSPTQPLTLAKWIEMGTKTFGWHTEMRQVNSYTQCTVLVSPHEVRPS